MDTLFHVEPRFPEGFAYIPDFITKEEELELLNLISATDFHTFLFHGYEAKRRVHAYGYDYSFDQKKLSKGEAIPETFFPLIKKVAERAMVKSEDFAELLLTEYPSGAVINWHRDAPPFELIAGISLLSDCRFMLRPWDKARQSRKNVLSFPVERRSLYIMQGRSRHEWEHSTAPVSDVRYSVTLRTLNQEANSGIS